MSDKRCHVGGLDRSEKVDKITIQNAVETPFWMAVWAAEPNRLIDVRMSYSDLKILCDLIDEKRNNGWIPVEESLPEIDGFYIATMDGKIIGQEEPFTGLAEFENGKWVDDEDDYKCVIAWRPLPERYLPGKRRAGL